MAERALWAGVVLQACADIEIEPRGSVVYNQAVAFFLHAGEWGQARLAVADFLGLHPDDLTRLGRKAIAARDGLEGGPAAPPVRPRSATTAVDESQVRRNRQWWIDRFLKEQGLGE